MIFLVDFKKKISDSIIENLDILAIIVWKKRSKNKTKTDNFFYFFLSDSEYATWGSC